MSDELKLIRCGCCGEAEIIKRFSPDYDLDIYYAKCKNCGIETDDYFFESEAIVAWNIAMGAKDINVPDKERTEKVFGEDGDYWHVCTDCDRSVEESWKYCPICGRRLEWNE